MTPKKLLTWFAPFLAVYALVSLFGEFIPEPDPVAGWQLKLGTPWMVAVSLVQSVFVLGFVTSCVVFIRKIPVRPIQIALGLLATAHLLLGLDGALLALGRWYFRPFLFTEMATLFALWHAFTTAARLERA
jgi:hypothetical protein